jgi:DNA-directed RNA polymerase specialized sigma24 family protein
MTAIPATADSPRALTVRQEDFESLPPFRTVHDCYFDFVWTCARRFGIPTDAVDDIVQEVFIVVHARLKTVERPTSLRSVLADIEEMTAPEISEAVGIPLNTVYSRLRIARQEFSEIVARERARAQARE